MRFLYLIFLALLVFSFAQYSDYDYDDYYDDDYDYEEEVDTVEEDFDNDHNSRRPHPLRPGNNFKPVGRERCKCCRFSRGRCVEMNCCQKYRVNCKHTTLTKPKN